MSVSEAVSLGSLYGQWREIDAIAEWFILSADCGDLKGNPERGGLLSFGQRNPTLCFYRQEISHWMKGVKLKLGCMRRLFFLQNFFPWKSFYTTSGLCAVARNAQAWNIHRWLGVKRDTTGPFNIAPLHSRKKTTFREDLKGWISVKRGWSPQPSSTDRKAPLRVGELGFGSALVSRDTSLFLLTVEYD